MAAKVQGRFTQSVGSKQRERLFSSIYRIIIALLALAFAMFPVLWVFSASIDPTNSLVNQQLIPPRANFDNYEKLFVSDSSLQFWRWMWNSLYIAAITTVLGVILCALAAYAFSRFRFRGRRSLLQTVLLIQVFPNFLSMVAIYLILRQVGEYIPQLGLNTHGGLILVYLGGTLGMNTWLMKGFFDSVPRDLDEAATIDGASPWQTFRLVILPLVRPILVVVGLLIFIGVFQEYVFSRILLTSSENYTLAVGLSQYIQQSYDRRWGIFAAGALIGALPIMILMQALQKYLVGGLTAGAVKG